MTTPNKPSLPPPTTPPPPGATNTEIGAYRFRHWSITSVCHSLVERMSGSYGADLTDEELQVEGTWLQWRLDHWHGNGQGPWGPFDNAVKELIRVTVDCIKVEVANRAARQCKEVWKPKPSFDVIGAHHRATRNADGESFWLVRGPSSDLFVADTYGVVKVTSVEMGELFFTSEPGTPGISGVSPYSLWSEWCPCLDVLQDYRTVSWPKLV